MVTPWEYIKQKRIDDKTLTDFKVGVLSTYFRNGEQNQDPNWFTFFSFDFPKEILDNACSIHIEKITIPVFDLYGGVLGTVTRTFSERLSKYLNDFKKSKHLFGLNVTWKDILENNSVYVVEGPIDCMILHQNGIRNVVSAGGISLSDDQICLLRRFCKKVIIVFDRDERGYQESVNLKDKIIDMGMECTVLCLPEGYDPDDFINEKGVESFRSIV